jgi:hypothetical protein
LRVWWFSDGAASSPPASLTSWGSIYWFWEHAAKTSELVTQYVWLPSTRLCNREVKEPYWCPQLTMKEDLSSCCWSSAYYVDHHRYPLYRCTEQEKTYQQYRNVPLSPIIGIQVIYHYLSHLGFQGESMKCSFIKWLVHRKLTHVPDPLHHVCSM